MGARASSLCAAGPHTRLNLGYLALRPIPTRNNAQELRAPLPPPPPGLPSTHLDLVDLALQVLHARLALAHLVRDLVRGQGQGTRGHRGGSSSGALGRQRLGVASRASGSGGGGGGQPGRQGGL